MVEIRLNINVSMHIKAVLVYEPLNNGILKLGIRFNVVLLRALEDEDDEDVGFIVLISECICICIIPSLLLVVVSISSS